MYAIAASSQNSNDPEARIACFVQGRTAPSSRFRILQYLPRLAQHGIKADVFISPPGPGGWTSRTLPGPVYRLVRRASQLAVYLPRRYAQLLTVGLQDYDAVFLQKQLSPARVGALLERCAAVRNPRIIFDVDDAIFAGSGGRDYFEAVCRLSRCVVAGNRFLADRVPAGTEIAVLPTTVDEQRFSPASDLEPSKPVCIGWTGSGSNLRYLTRLRPVFEALAREGATFRIICNRVDVPELAGIPGMEFVTWRADTEVKDLQQVDIGLMPLEDNIWTRGKCAFKLVQYMAIGIPAVASPVGANTEVLEHQVTGFFADSTEDWQHSLVRLVRDIELRRRMGAAARQRFVDTLSLSDNAARLATAIHKVAGS